MNSSSHDHKYTKVKELCEKLFQKPVIDDASLLELVHDSFGFVNCVLFIETQLEVEFDESKLDPYIFHTQKDFIDYIITLQK